MDQNQLYDRQTIEVMRQVISIESNCIDVGCHAGVILQEMLKLSPRGVHYAFEPLPEFAEKLCAKFSGYGNVNIINKALSDVQGNVNFQYVVTNPGYSGIKKRKYDRENEVIEEITVETMRLDDLIPKSLSISFIKIDVEGGELQVLLGAKDTIRRSRPVIVFEHGLGAADYYGTNPEDVYDFFSIDCGMSCYLMNEWLESNGKKEIDKSRFCDEFRSGRNYYFMAA